jgi:DNA (cytosine-5)-methyltransferase 1
MRAYYNEIDPYCIAWLRNLISAGCIAPGDIDERSIADVQPDDLREYTQCHFFAGIGGWSYALRLAEWNDNRPVWTGSCPCQPLSSAGQHKGHADERHLWPAFYRLIAECQPTVLFGEQVASKDGREWLAAVRFDLEALEYAVGAADLCAAGVGAPHIRQRLWFVADAVPTGWTERRLGAGNEQVTRSGCARELADTDGRHASAEGLQRSWEHRQQPEDGEHGELDDAAIARRSAQPQRPTRTDGRQTAEPGRLRDAGELEHAAREQEGFPRRSRQSRGTYWSNCDWLPCVDGKARPVESGTQSMADGLSGAMGLMRSNPSIAKEIINAAQSVGLTDQILSALRSGHRAPEIWQSLGRCIGVSEAAILLACVCEHSGQLGRFFYGQASRGEQDGKAELREMRQTAPMAARSPLGWRLSEQFAGKLADALSFLPQARTLASFNGFPLSHGIPGRVGRLRAYGNSIVPQVAAEFISAFMD